MYVINLKSNTAHYLDSAIIRSALISLYLEWVIVWNMLELKLG